MVKPSADVEEKKKFILQELYETEVNYVNALNLIGMVSNDICIPSAPWLQCNLYLTPGLMSLTLVLPV